MDEVVKEFGQWFKRAVQIEIPLTEHNYSPGVLRFASKYYESEVADLSKVFGLSIVEDVLMFKGKHQMMVYILIPNFKINILLIILINVRV